MNDMVIVSVDDHISEPPTMFDRHLKGDALATAPKLRTTEAGTNYWDYQGMKLPSVGLNAVVGRVPEEYGVEPTAFSQLRKGIFEPRARLDDMNVNGVAASLNFGSFPGFDGGVFARAADKVQAIQHLRAYNDWHIDEWCGTDQGRFIPCGILPCWDPQLMVEEIKRISRKGCTAVSINENPTIQGLPSIHNPYWEPMFKAIVEEDMVICLHIGGGNPAPHASMETPIEAWISTMPISIAVGAADWLHLEALERYPTLKLALSEGGIGWIPYFTERSDFSHERHKAWTHSRFKGTRPSEVFKKHFMCCFIDDAYGLQNLPHIGEDMVAYECDYPHSDSLWPDVPEWLIKSVAHLTDLQIDKVTHLNAMRWFRFDPFKYHKKQDLTVGALRAKAKADKIDIRLQSFGGEKPLQDGEAIRPITSGDVVKMFTRHRQAPGVEAAQQLTKEARR
jgi:predicted TIM-barrel fold metal-dependent hydrolase